MHPFPIIWQHGQWAQAHQTGIDIADLGLNRGYAVFDFLKVLQGRPLYLAQHLQRLWHSATAMHLAIPFTQQQIADAVHALLVQNNATDAGVKILVTGGTHPSGYGIGSPQVLISLQPLVLPQPADHERGIRVMTWPHQRELAHIKTTNYAMGIWLQPRLAAAGLHDVLYHQHDHVLESPRSNVFALLPDGTLVTPATGILHGITRQQVLHLASSWLPVQERPLPLQALLQATEVFICSTTRRIMPVVAIDGQPVGNGQAGPISLQLLQQLLQHEMTQ